MNSIFRIVLIFFLACASCSSSQASRNVDLSQGLPLPSIPGNLREPQLRADYLVKHWWEQMDWSDDKYALDTLWMEKAFVDYATVLSISTQGDSLQSAVNALFESASVNPHAYSLLGSIAEKYLFEPESPVYSEEAYVYFANAQLGSDHISPAQRERMGWQARMASLNQPGTLANDFIFEDRNGQKQSLQAIISGAQSLIIFYDPDCDDCHHLISSLAADSALAKNIDDGRCRIVAIADGETEESWRNTANSLPSNWIVGLDITDIQVNELYYLPTTPTLVLTDASGRIVMKNAPQSPTLQRFLTLH